MISLPRLNNPPKSAPPSRRLRCLTPASIRLRHVLGLERPRHVAGAIPRGHQLRVERSNLVYRHAVGGAAKDELVYEEKDERFGVGVWKSLDDKYLFLDSSSHTTSEVRFKPADTAAGTQVPSAANVWPR